MLISLTLATVQLSAYAVAANANTHSSDNFVKVTVTGKDGIRFEKSGTSAVYYPDGVISTQRLNISTMSILQNTLNLEKDSCPQ